MTAFERVFARVQKRAHAPRPKTEKEREQLRKDLIELAERAAKARRAGVPVQLSRYMRSLMKMEGVRIPRTKRG